MPFFKIFHGLGGGFGGAQYDYTGEFKSKEEAQEEARRMAVEDYESYEGCHGILSWEDCRESLLRDNGCSEDEIDEYSGRIDALCEEYGISEEDVDDMYQEELESWITFKVVSADSLDDEEEDEDIA